uniref:Uncharacterized protein n=1 Tax=Candidatus Kentrum sp. SD TaxID=2126332 RepID=A0A450YF52_9GAMM|nr:MAG: hypothetical protein BECKSD772F_GA0070984_105218 [Candidatus Kentron sp. SD]VFK45240.1 MAG: hypothetical protein BECKSD772E_GA0070983_105018 [Candidatus Kentron sp. SD]
MPPPYPLGGYSRFRGFEVSRRKAAYDFITGHLKCLMIFHKKMGPERGPIFSSLENTESENRFSLEAVDDTEGNGVYVFPSSGYPCIITRMVTGSRSEVGARSH